MDKSVWIHDDSVLDQAHLNKLFNTLGLALRSLERFMGSCCSVCDLLLAPSESESSELL